MNTLTKAPLWFTLIAIVAVLWNLMGLGAYVSQTMMTPEMLATLGENERSMYENFPLWANIAFAVAVISGLLGGIALLLKKKWALSLFILSMLGIIVQMGYSVFMSGASEIYGPTTFIMPVLVTLGGIALIWLSKKAIGNNWLA